MRELHELSMYHDHSRRHSRMIMILRDYQRGMSYKDMRQKYGCAHATLCRYIKANNLSNRKPVVSKAQREKCLKLLRTDEFYAAIATACGISERTVQNIAHQHGIRRHAPKGTVQRKGAGGDGGEPA